MELESGPYLTGSHNDPAGGAHEFSSGIFETWYGISIPISISLYLGFLF